MELIVLKNKHTFFTEILITKYIQNIYIFVKSVSYRGC